MDGDDDDFGSFDEASFDDFAEAEPQEESVPEIEPTSVVHFDSKVFSNTAIFQSNLDNVMAVVFPNAVTQPQESHTSLLSERSSHIYQELSSSPHLQPPNWTRLKIRHNLLIKLGIPVNLDELDSKHLQPPQTHTRKKSIHEQDIDWSGLEIPQFSNLSISTENKNSLMDETPQILSKIETENLSNSSRQFLESSSDDQLSAKLAALTENYNQLLTLSSVWQDQLDEQKKNFEIYESVVQNLIGYSQRLRRDELLEKLKKMKKSKRKSFWKGQRKE